MELGKEVPKVVSLVALGASKIDFLNETMLTGSPKGLADEVWVINKMGVIIKHDMLFRMDDLRTAYSCNMKSFAGGNVPDGMSVHDTYDNWLKNHDKPIITSTAYKEYPTSVAFPLEEIINLVGYAYFRTTPAYAVAYAMYIGGKQLRIYGCDYVYPTDKYKAEAGRANMEYILSIAMQRGMDVFIAPKSTLMDQCVPDDEKMYGYLNPMDIVMDTETGKCQITPRPDAGKKKRERNSLKEREQLQMLMSKYKEDVMKDLIVGNWITKDMIDDVKKKEEKEKKETTKIEKQIKNLGASSKKGTTQKSRKKENKNANTKKIHKRSNNRRK
jgi:hypothetical protein